MARTLRAGQTLIELVIAVAIGALVLAGLGSVVLLGLSAQSAGGQANELLYQGQFALERMLKTARSVSPKLLATPTAGTTGNWFSAVNVMYCMNGSSQLIETTPADSGCTGTTVIASNVTAFSAQLVAGAGPVDRPAGTLSLTLAHSAAPQTVSLSTSVRLGGGTL